MRLFFLLLCLALIAPRAAASSYFSILNPLFIRVQGSEIIREDGQKIRLKGFNLSNYAHGNWKNGVNIRPQVMPDWVLTEQDVIRLKEIGVNVVRYTFNYDLFEPENASKNFEKINRHLEWFNRHGIYVFLNLHITKGRSSAFLSTGLTIFENQELWDHFEDMWTRILKYYKNSTVIAGIEFFNEPRVPKKGRKHFIETIDQFVKRMRQIDPNHIFIIPNPEGATNPDGSDNWDFQPLFKLEDNNILYTFHYYEPKDFTHQKFWQSIPANGMRYPFLKFNKTEYIPFQTPMKYKEEERPTVKEGWKLSQSKPFLPPEKATFGTLSFVAGNEEGSVWFDNPKLYEIAPNGEKKEIPLPNPSFKPYAWDFINQGEFDPDQYYGLQYYVADLPHEKVKFLKPKNQVKPGDVHVSIAYPGYDDATALKISNAYTGVTNISFDQRVFPIFPKPGYQYQIETLIKLENSKPHDPKKGKFNNIDMSWFKADEEIIDREWMKKDITWKYVNWAKENNVPIFCGEFGSSNFIRNDYRIHWASDVASVLNDLGIHWTYWEYKGIFGWGYSFSIVNQQTDHPEKEFFINEPLLQAIEKKLEK